MEYIIIFILIIIIIIIILLKQINSIKKFKKCNNKLKSIVVLKKFDKYILFPNNPIILYLYEKLYRFLKTINKYDYKSYIIFTKIKTSTDNQIFFDWISYTSGTIRMSIDSVIKILKKKEYLNNDFINIIAKIKLYYTIFNIKVNIDKVNKNIIKNVHNKLLQTNTVIFNLFYIYEILNNMTINFFSNLDKSKMSINIKKIIKENTDNYKNNNIYLYNSYLNNRLNKNYLQNNTGCFEEYFNQIN